MDKEVGGFYGGGDSLCVMDEKESRGLSPAGGIAAELPVVGRSAACCCREGERHNFPAAGYREGGEMQPICCWLT